MERMLVTFPYFWKFIVGTVKLMGCKTFFSLSDEMTHLIVLEFDIQRQIHIMR